ncbi:hypothetical protein JTB14_015910 [Gonioctena quinquepunctata]|nr:hypothetical protein JTB14_015910 [Gonioctena quinquepunctata]
MPVCSTCKRSLEEDLVIICDGCKRNICCDCPKLFSTELRCMTLKKKKLIFLCDECEQGFRILPVLLNKIENLEARIGELKEMKESQIETQTTSEQINSSVQLEHVIAEIEERKYCAKNVIFKNISESSNSNRAERNAEEMQTILGLINNVSITDTHVKVQRIGKFGNGLNRLLKVTFANSEDAKEVLRSKDKLKPVMIFGDQTKKQRAYYKQVKEELNRLIANGDDIPTKYPKLSIRYLYLFQQ